MFGNRLDHERIQVEAEARAEDRSPKHPYWILDEPHARIPDGPNHAPLEVSQSTDVVDDRPCRDVVEEPVDREVAAERIFFRGAERVVAMEDTVVAALRVASVRPALTLVPRRLPFFRRR